LFFCQKEILMNRFAFLICTFAIIVGTVKPTHAAFTGGDLVILGTSSNTDTTTDAITLYDYSYNSLTGTFNTTPTAHSITGITLPGVNDHDGLLHQSTDGNYLTFGGYQVSAGTTPTSGTPHAIGVVDSSWAAYRGRSCSLLAEFTGVISGCRKTASANTARQSATSRLGSPPSRPAAGNCRRTLSRRCPG
jgi:hypothetical protein